MNWTEEQTKELLELKSLNYSNKILAEHFDCSVDCVKDKLSRTRKKLNIYNIDHVDEKYDINMDFFLDLPNPKTILDPFCGVTRFWKSRFEEKGILVMDNDKDRAIAADFHEDAKILLNNLAKFGFNFDLVDIDPFGDAADYIDSGIQLANMGLIVTNGFIKNGSRFKSNYWEQKYGKEFLPTEEHFISYIEERGRIFGKTLKVYSTTPKKWTNCNRIWFTVEKR